MRAVRVERPSGGHAVHWLAAGDEWTLCGRRIRVLLTVERLDLTTLPDGEGCAACAYLVNDPSYRRRSPVTAEPERGRLRTAGPLYHGLGRRAGQRLRGGDE